MNHAMAFALAIVTGPAATASQHDIESLRERVSALEARIEALEAARSFTSFMPDFSERFHVMHYAGDAGDWAVAKHELLTLQGIAERATDIDLQQGKMLQQMLAPAFDQLETAIEHGNRKQFHSALEATVTSCNACHAATGNAFIQVTLDPPARLNMRHPHKLTKSEAPGDHAHTH
jgi:cytochrome c553